MRTAVRPSRLQNIRFYLIHHPKLMVRSLIASVGVFSIGLIGCTPPQNFASTAQARLNNVKSTQQAQAPSESETQAPVANPVSPTPAPTRTPDVVYVPTPPQVVDEMIRIADVKPTDVVYDLGSGDGRIVIAAAKQRGARGIGIDINPARVREATYNAKKAGVSDLVQFRQQDLFETDFSEATVVMLYLLPRLNMRLRPKLLRDLKPGTRIVSHSFDMGNWKPDQVVEVDGRMVYYWVVPENPPANLLQPDVEELG
ncbi:MAG TPA: class I SAM-dependent methyltransferase [Leptolyngbyaceae cyanobacterium M33_DOE_097]|uniref:Class I SAM-dependent methyltransferase n=1 Tax=Oscillatoriales cyanobacterium SpSt-418 TaxID=2282169 RepID=A0A7C3PU32_9CYAN|nr:class I SAM-dependent methyltransferase [Leptolyngbyaceae cyanobacterium M33_DOE_097]